MNEEKVFTRTDVKNMLTDLVEFIAESQSIVEILAHVDKLAQKVKEKEQ